METYIYQSHNRKKKKKKQKKEKTQDEDFRKRSINIMNYVNL